jgi:hypothetical protein
MKRRRPVLEDVAWLLAVALLALWLAVAMTGCFRIPVETYAPTTEAGEVAPLPVATAPIYAVPQTDSATGPWLLTSDAPAQPAPQPFPWGTILDVALTILGVGGGAVGGWGMLAARAAKTAIKLTAEYGDDLEDGVPVAKAKAKAEKRQLGAGVHSLIQKARGKA